MTRHGRLAKEVCLFCGRELEPGERRCPCEDKLIPKDGLRARCPRFASRSDYQGKSYISCGGKKLKFSHRDSRDIWYECMCCRAPEKCGMRHV